MKTFGYANYLQEIRKRIVYAFIYFFIAVIFGFIVAGPTIQWLKPEHLEWNMFALADALGIYIKVATLIGFALSFPFFLYQIWAFVRPNLQGDVHRSTQRFIPISFLLFVLGFLFAYFILLPMILQFMVTITAASGAELVLGINQFFSFLFGIIVPVSLLFELPLVVIFLTRVRILNPERLRKFRKYAYLLLVITATIVTPPELITEILVAIPLIILYEISVWLARKEYKKQLAKEDEVL